MVIQRTQPAGLGLGTVAPLALRGSDSLVGLLSEESWRPHVGGGSAEPRPTSGGDGDGLSSLVAERRKLSAWLWWTWRLYVQRSPAPSRTARASVVQVCTGHAGSFEAHGLPCEHVFRAWDRRSLKSFASLNSLRAPRARGSKTRRPRCHRVVSGAVLRGARPCNTALARPCG